MPRAPKPKIKAAVAVEEKPGTDRLVPLHDKIIVRTIEEDERTPGGLWIPDQAQGRPCQGRVLAAGPGLRDERGHLWPMTVKVGDRVLFGKYLGNAAKVDEEELLILREVEVYGIVRED